MNYVEDDPSLQVLADASHTYLIGHSQVRPFWDVSTRATWETLKSVVFQSRDLHAFRGRPGLVIREVFWAIGSSADILLTLSSLLCQGHGRCSISIFASVCQVDDDAR